MLEIGVHRNHDVSSSSLQSGEQCGLVSEISRQTYPLHSPVGALQVVEDVERVILAAIVDDDDLVLVG